MTARAAAGRAMRGFSLMELMITLAIAAIIAAVAIPSYTAFVERGKRAAARSALLLAAAALERSYTTNGCYNRSSVAACQAQSGAALQLADLGAGLTRAPAEGRQSHLVTLVSASQTYTLTATPCKTAGTCPGDSDSFEDGKCGALTLDQAGVRGATKSGADLNFCWQR